jgi:hypothetical protein
MFIAVSGIVFILIYIFSGAGYFRVFCGIPAETGFLTVNAGYFSALTDCRNIGKVCVPPPHPIIKQA